MISGFNSTAALFHAVQMLQAEFSDEEGAPADAFNAALAAAAEARNAQSIAERAWPPVL